MLSPPRLHLSLLTILALSGCGDTGIQLLVVLAPEVDRHAAIPADVQKVAPEDDLFPPILHSYEFHEPVPLPIISTAGGEDAPFIPLDRDELYFFFAADIRDDPSILTGFGRLGGGRMGGGYWKSFCFQSYGDGWHC